MIISPVTEVTDEYVHNLNNPKINRFLSTHNKPQTKEMVEEWVKVNKPLGIYIKRNLVGTINLSIHIPVVGVLIFKNHQKKGYGVEAINKVKVDKMLAGIDDKNIESKNLFKKAGFKKTTLYQYKEL